MGCVFACKNCLAVTGGVYKHATVLCFTVTAPLVWISRHRRGSVYGTSLVLHFLCCGSACLSVGWRNDGFLNSKGRGQNTSSRVLWYRRTPRKPHGLCLNQVAREYEPEVPTCTVCGSLCKCLLSCECVCNSLCKCLLSCECVSSRLAKKHEFQSV